MKSSLLIISILCSIALAAQTYHPFPSKNAMWAEAYYSFSTFGKPQFHCFALKNSDTIINDKIYHKIYHSLDTLLTEDELCGGIREENKRVYFYPIDSIGYPGQITSPSEKKEFVLYDFSLQIGDSIDGDTFRLSVADYPGYLKVVKIDSIIVGNEYRKTFHFGRQVSSREIPNATWIEGIGNVKGLLFMTGEECECGIYSWLTCFFKDNVNLYHSGVEDCFYLATSSTTKPRLNPAISIKPNPIETKGAIEFNGIKYVSLKLINMFGSTVRNYDVRNASSFEIFKGNLTAGAYILQLKDIQGNIRTAKLIIK